MAGALLSALRSEFWIEMQQFSYIAVLKIGINIYKARQVFFF